MGVGGLKLICQHSKTSFCDDTHTFAAEYEDMEVNMKSQRYDHTQWSRPTWQPGGMKKNKIVF